MNSEPDKQGHMYGPDSIETRDAVSFYLFMIIIVLFFFLFYTAFTS